MSHPEENRSVRFQGYRWRCAKARHCGHRLGTLIWVRLIFIFVEIEFPINRVPSAGPEVHLEDFDFDLPGYGEGFIAKEQYNHPLGTQGRGANAQPARPRRARFGFDQVPGYRPGNQHLKEKEWLPDQ